LKTTTPTKKNQKTESTTRNEKLTKGKGLKFGNLEGNRRLIPGFFYYRQNLLEFFKVFKNCNAALGNGEDYASFTNGAFFHQTLLHEEVKVFLEDAAVDVCFVHDVG
jgi:hypothetical protein